MKKFLCFLLLGITRCAYPAEITAPSGATSSQITPITNSITDILDLGGAAVTGVTTLTTSGGVEIVSTVQALETNAMTKAVYDTNGDDTVDHAQSADTAADSSTATYANTAGYSDNSGAFGGQPPTHYLTTNGNGSALTNLPVRCQVFFSALPTGTTTIDGLVMAPFIIPATAYGALGYSIHALPSNSIVRQTTTFYVHNLDTNRPLYRIGADEGQPVYPARSNPVTVGTGGVWRAYVHVTEWTNNSPLNSMGARPYMAFNSTSSFPWYVLSTEVVATPLN